jgi:hypothetical protein
VVLGDEGSTVAADGEDRGDAEQVLARDAHRDVQRNNHDQERQDQLILAEPERLVTAELWH